MCVCLCVCVSVCVCEVVSIAGTRGTPTELKFRQRVSANDMFLGMDFEKVPPLHSIPIPSHISPPRIAPVTNLRYQCYPLSSFPIVQCCRQRSLVAT